jgi:hypothetical protein
MFGLRPASGGGLQNPIIDFMSASLDPRVVLSAPAHAYLAQDGRLKQSAANQWPLEFRNGVAVGRHEPERATQNYLLDPHFSKTTGTAIADQWTLVGGGLGGLDQIGGIDGGPSILTVRNYSKGGVYDGSAWLLPDSTPWNVQALTGGWERISMMGSIPANKPIAQGRFYTARQDSANYVYYSGMFPSGNVTFSSIRLPFTSSNDQYRHSLAQIEIGSNATSPVYGSRVAMSAYIDEPLAASALVEFSDGSTASLQARDGHITIPVTSLDWSKRFITKITME